jgi:hypothetical protein
MKDGTVKEIQCLTVEDKRKIYTYIYMLEQ